MSEIKAGTITVYLGSMYAGKTSALIREYRRWKSIDKKTLMINHTLDDRYGHSNMMSTHDQDQPSIPCCAVAQLRDVDANKLQATEAIFINEGQFFDDLLDTCLYWCEKLGKHLFICGLDGDRDRKPFGQMLFLLPFATDYHKLTAKCQICKDGTDASFTLDTENKRAKSQIIVGTTQYLPVCRQHYLEINA